MLVDRFGPAHIKPLFNLPPDICSEIECKPHWANTTKSSVWASHDRHRRVVAIQPRSGKDVDLEAVEQRHQGSEAANRSARADSFSGAFGLANQMLTNFSNMIMASSFARRQRLS